MAGKELGSSELPEAVGVNTVSREDLNEAITSLKSSMTTEVKYMFKEFLDTLKLSTDAVPVANPTNSTSDVNSGKEGALSPSLPVAPERRCGNRHDGDLHQQLCRHQQQL